MIGFVSLIVGVLVMILLWVFVVLPRFSVDESPKQMEQHATDAVHSTLEKAHMERSQVEKTDSE